MKREKIFQFLAVGTLSILIFIYASSFNEIGESAKSTTLSVSSKEKDLKGWIDSLVVEYRKDVDRRISSISKIAQQKGIPQPVKPELGGEYIKAFRSAMSGPQDKCGTYAVTISEKEIAYFINYLYDMRYKPEGKNGLQFAFGKYDVTGDYGQIDPDLLACPKRHGRVTLIVGVASKYEGDCKKNPNCSERDFIMPFKDDKLTSKKNPGDSVSFYDDWHELWP